MPKQFEGLFLYGILYVNNANVNSVFGKVKLHHSREVTTLKKGCCPKKGKAKKKKVVGGRGVGNKWSEKGGGG